LQPSPTADGPARFCGATLFAGGCGRLFEGTPAQMCNSLRKFQSRPDTTQVFCAHEYTLANLAFAAAVESDNAALATRIEQAKLTRAQDKPTVPSTIGLEKATNPFMRCETDSIKNAAERHCEQRLTAPADVLGAIRAWKDSF